MVHSMPLENVSGQSYKVRKMAKIRNRYDQRPRLTQNTYKHAWIQRQQSKLLDHPS